MQRFEKKTVLITGGAGAIGLACGLRLASEGAHVVLADLRFDNPEAIQAQFAHRGASAPELVQLDVRSRAQWEQIAQSIVDKHGRLDVLVNNAGMIPRQPAAFDELDLDEWRQVFAVNVEGALLGMQTALKTMKTQAHGGAIVNMGSISGYVGSKDLGTYASSKGALKTMSKQAAISAARHGYQVRVNAVHPGYLWTPFVEQQLTERFGGREQALEAVKQMNPMGQIVEPADVAAAVAFLASADARMITGADLVVDGGRLVQ
ncbi:SDR family NAD(P)-dependent oxidoreductase [Comamonas sp. GB3 AK4-5]|uniref:SDR family NAD(P)-dependent oxidoreductase n=1 Tax=Comamonas sp. GB3 AK4-5 TaxID=3231487 RepID=UPI00351DC904